MSITTTHERCATCDWLGREAERTATALGRESWLSTTEDQGVTHYARYEKGTDMTTIDTTALRALAEAATPGPWRPEWSEGDDSYDITGQPYDDMMCPVVGYADAERDAAHIAAFHPGTALALLAEVEALRKMIERVREVHWAVEVEPSATICGGCSTRRGQGDTLRYFPYVEWPCATIRRALDGEVEA